MLNLAKIGNDVATHNSVNGGFTEHEMPSGCEDNGTSDLTGSGKEGQQVKFHMLALYSSVFLYLVH